jgi:hypothetical protein
MQERLRSPLCSRNARPQKSLVRRAHSRIDQDTVEILVALASGGTRDEAQASTFAQIDWIVPEE